MFAVDGTIEGRRACVLMIARSKEHGRGFRTSYYEHTGASGFNHSINGKHGNIIMGLILMIRKVRIENAALAPWLPFLGATPDPSDANQLCLEQHHLEFYFLGAFIASGVNVRHIENEVLTITREVTGQKTKKVRPLPSGIFVVGKFCSANGIAFNDYCREFVCSYWLSSFDRANKVFYTADARRTASILRLACGRCPHSAGTSNHPEALSAKHKLPAQLAKMATYFRQVMRDGGAHHPSTSIIGVSAGAVSPVVVNGPHTGAGFFLIDKHGWLAGAGKEDIWQSFGGKRQGDESPWQTASREMLEETGIPSEHLASLAPPFHMRKDDHVYVLHIAMIRSTHEGSTFPMVTSQELTRFRHFTSFADAFRSELGKGEMAHHRDIEPAFLKTAAEVHRAISIRARAASTATLPRPDPGNSPSAVSTSVSFSDDASAGDELLPHPLLHESNNFDHEASGRKHARMLPNRVAREATWIDAVGQHEIN